MGRRIAQAVGIAFLLIGVVSAKTPIYVSPSSASMMVGATVKLTATTAAGTVTTVRWSSSAPGIAGVNSVGVVTGMSAGTATIMAKSGPSSAKVSITVTAPPPPPSDPQPQCSDGIDNDGDGLIDGADPGCSSATDNDETDPRPPPSDPPPPTIDPSWILIYPGDSIQNFVNQYPGATTFYLKAGTFHQQWVVPKSGNQFIGEAGAVLDGDRVTPYAFETLTSHPTGVLIQGLEIRNYATPAGRGTIQGDNGTNWVVSNNVIHDNANPGLRLGVGMQALNNAIYRNGVAGIIGYRSDNALVENNEVFGNNPSGGSTGSDAGMKLVGCTNLAIRGNYVHGNLGKGIWSDTNYPTVLIENNHVADNWDTGIWHEIGYAAIIRYNTIERNGGTTAPSWLQAGGIAVTNSPNVQVYGNTVVDNANGIGVMYATGYPTTGPYGAYIVQNLYIHDNVVRMGIGRTGMATNTGDTSIYSSQNNHFEHNTYYLGATSQYFLWSTQNLTENQWMALGNDETGQFIR